MTHYREIIQLYNILSDTLDVLEDEEYNYIITYTDNINSNIIFTRNISDDNDMFLILLHEYKYDFLESHNVEQVKDLSEPDKNNYFIQLNSLKESFYKITKRCYSQKDESGFGTILNQIRTRKKYSKKELSKSLCTTRTLSRIEDNDIPCPLSLSSFFTYRLNIDLIKCYNDLNLFGTLEAYFIINDFFSIVETRNKKKLKEIISKMENLPEMHSDINLKHLLYPKILDYSTDNKIEEAMNCCFVALQLNTNANTFDVQSINLKLYTYIDYIILAALAYCYMALNKIDKAEKILKSIAIILEEYTNIEYIQNIEKEKQLYQMVCINLAAIHYRHKDYINALKYVETGISFAYLKNNLYLLSAFYQKKFCILCRLHRWEEAQLAYNIAYYTAIQTGKEDDKELLKTLKNDYDELYLKKDDIF